MMTRRATLAALLALPAALEAGAAGEEFLGSTVFHWKEMRATKNAKGEVRSLVRQPTATLAQLEMHVTTLDPGQASHEPHRHANEELILLREGEVETLSKGAWVRVEPGSVIFNASNDLHALRNVGAGPATYHVINFSTEKTLRKS